MATEIYAMKQKCERLYHFTKARTEVQTTRVCFVPWESNQLKLNILCTLSCGTDHLLRHNVDEG